MTFENARFNAIKEATSRSVRKFERPKDSAGNYLPICEYYGCNVFSYDLLSDQRGLSTELSEKEIQILKKSAASSTSLDKSIAEKVANAVKKWAVGRGATHYCHWFLPQTGATAEKHDSFLCLTSDGQPLEQFSAKELIQAEPDASSFPSGGRRSTFEARGYTVWDTSSPMFLRETENGSTLCIPSIFVSLSGEPLDKKTPLLLSIKSLSKIASQSLSLLGVKDVEYVIATCGAEQEYFLVDKAFYNLRPDFMLAGRCMVGQSPPKGQQLDDHYFGSIKPRILNYMMECEYELYRLGVPCKTRHNETAPSQFEIAPIYQYANIAADQNQLVMEVLRSVARRHDLVVLFHEKPYPYMNGSGKHLNWSLADNTGTNLLEPGKHPDKNLRFLYFLTAVVRAVYEYGSLLRCTVASAGNEFRLGANEAPPAIMSVYLGKALRSILEKVSGNGSDFKDDEDWESSFNMALSEVPEFSKDNTDRNRTSPFAFTGSKFEFRTPGSSASVGPAITYLNIAVAESLSIMNARLFALMGEKTQATSEQILAVISETYLESKKICYDGNNYSDEWKQKAMKRGLPDFSDIPTAIKVLLDDKNTELLLKHSIYGSKAEVVSRYHVLVERYNKTRLIELETLAELLSSNVLPVAFMQIKNISDMVNSLQTAVSSKLCNKSILDSKLKSLQEVSDLTDNLVDEYQNLKALIKTSRGLDDPEAIAKLYAKECLELMGRIRKISGKLELQIDDSIWNLPKIRDMIYLL